MLTCRPRRAAAGLLALLLLTAAVTANATTYRWVDSKGVIHYSDQPEPGAAKVNLPQAQTYNSGVANTAPAEPTAQVDTANSPGERPAVNDAACMLASPQDQQTFSNVYSVAVAAKGPNGAIAKLMLDGAEVQQGASSEFVINPIARGEHRVAVVFASAAGGELCRTKTITFFVRQPGLLNPQRKRR